MPSRRAVIVSSCEPCASARSKSRPFAQRRSACSRDSIWRALPVDDRPPWWPITRRGHAVRLDQLHRLRVVARRDLDLVTLRLAAARRAAGTPAGAPTPSCRSRPSCRQRRSELRASRRDALDVALVPEREREQPPHLAREVLASGDVVVEHARDGLGLQEALPADHLGRERLARERLAGRRAATPPPGSRSRACGRARPRPAAAARPPSAAAASSRGRAPCAATGSENAKFATTVSMNGTRASSDHAIDARSVFVEQVVDEVEAEVDVLQPRQQLVPLRLGEALAVGAERVEARCGGPSARRARRRRRSPSSRGGARAAAGARRARSASPCSRSSRGGSRSAAARRAAARASASGPIRSASRSAA